jgi:anti-sigma-K factor RskA
MAHSEDQIALAAEYALGTLDASERAQVEALMSADADFAALVRAWEFRLGALNQMVGLVEPRAEVWDRIKSAIGQVTPSKVTTSRVTSSEVTSSDVTVSDVTPSGVAASDAASSMSPQAAPAPSHAARDPAAADLARPIVVEDTANVISLAARARRWRNLAAAASAIAAALAALIATGLSRPDLLPTALRPRAEVAEVKTPPAASSAQYVAVLQKAGGSPAFILTVDGTTRDFTIRRVGDTAPDPGKSFELWMISDQLPQPRSLGVIGSGDFTARAVPASYDSSIVDHATYAVTMEQEGGSPDGVPHSAPIYTGKLIETVPATAPAK